jgi:hypothetical protein
MTTEQLGEIRREFKPGLENLIAGIVPVHGLNLSWPPAAVKYWHAASSVDSC